MSGRDKPKRDKITSKPKTLNGVRLQRPQEATPPPSGKIIKPELRWEEDAPDPKVPQKRRTFIL